MYCCSTTPWLSALGAAIVWLTEEEVELIWPHVWPHIWYSAAEGLRDLCSTSSGKISRGPPKQHLQAIFANPPTSLAVPAGPLAPLVTASGVTTSMCTKRRWRPWWSGELHIIKVRGHDKISMLLPGNGLISVIRPKVTNWWKERPWLKVEYKHYKVHFWYYPLRWPSQRNGTKRINKQKLWEKDKLADFCLLTWKRLFTLRSLRCEAEFLLSFWCLNSLEMRDREHALVARSCLITWHDQMFWGYHHVLSRGTIANIE